MLIEKRQLPEIINTGLKTQLKIEGKQYKDIECNEKNYLGFKREQRNTRSSVETDRNVLV